MSKYSEIAATVAREISDGHFQPGERIYSTSELCEKYNVSLMTAVRAHRALEEMGIVRKVRGGGTFANSVEDFSAAVGAAAGSTLQRVVVFKFGRYTRQTVHKITVASLIKRCTQIGLDAGFELIERQSVSLDAVNAMRPEPNTGYVIVSDSPTAHLAAGALLLSPNVRTVLIDSIISGSHAVLPDNYGGMDCLCDHLLACGYRSIFYAPRVKNCLGMVNASERRHAFELRSRRGDIDGRILESTNFSDLVAAFKAAGPRTAFMFPQDDPALRFLKILEETGVTALPGITGFDDMVLKEQGAERLTTLRVDRNAMGRAAVDVLFKSVELPEIVRVPGTLMVRESTKG